MIRNLDEALRDLHKFSWRVVNGKPANLGLLLAAGDVHREYEKIRPETEPQMTPKEIVNMALENVKKEDRMRKYIEITQCADCPFYSEFNNSEIYACRCLMCGNINEDDTKIMDDCPLKRMEFHVALRPEV